MQNETSTAIGKSVITTIGVSITEMTGDDATSAICGGVDGNNVEEQATKTNVDDGVNVSACVGDGGGGRIGNRSTIMDDSGDELGIVRTPKGGGYEDVDATSAVKTGQSTSCRCSRMDVK